eukprot:s3879_g9.t1
MTEIRNLPHATYLEQYQSQLLAMVRDSEVLDAFNYVQLSTLAIQIQELAALVAAAHSLPMDASHPMDANTTDDVQLTATDHNDL